MIYQYLDIGASDAAKGNASEILKDQAIIKLSVGFIGADFYAELSVFVKPDMEPFVKSRPCIFGKYAPGKLITEFCEFLLCFGNGFSADGMGFSVCCNAPFKCFSALANTFRKFSSAKIFCHK